ncbi:unnamed protein product [Parnassius apollo]|uniref:(apollo) hypothetical protein n=1 Tax=Parnassius apollo TaxID=110799 RepID=A0A8S3W5E7_PARAO|nr:unnamed protein product [Parnassius apollo]
MDADTFDEWFVSEVLTALKVEPGNKAIIGDNLSSDISIKTLAQCEENDIKFICLIPNSTHLLQPLDVAYFSSLKTNWRSVLNNWRNTRRGKIATALPKNVFASLLAGKNIIAGSKETGLFPCDVNVPLEKLPDYEKPIEEIRERIEESFKRYIDDIRNIDLGMKQIKKLQISVVAGKSVSVAEMQKFIDQREESKNKPKKKRQRKEDDLRLPKRMMK